MQVMMIGNVKGTKEAGLTIGDWLCNEELPCERSGYFTKQLPQIFSVFFLFLCNFHLGMLPLQLERRKSLWLWNRLSTITA